MPRYRYRAYDDKGVLTEGQMVARSREAVLDSIHRRGFFTLEVTDATALQSVRWWERQITLTGRSGIPLASLLMLTRELTTLIKADIPVDECLHVVSLQPALPRRVKSATEALLNGVREGASLSEAMAAQGTDFPEYYWRLVQSGESAGSLGEILEDLTHFLERTSEVRSKITSALLYPAVLLVVACVAVGVVVTVLLPVILPLFADAGAKPPPGLQFLIDAEIAARNQWPLVLTAIGAISFGLAALIRKDGVRMTLDRWVLKLPVIGRFAAHSETARFGRTLATLTKSGVPLLEATRITGGVMRNRTFKDAIGQAGKALSHGEPLLKPLERSGVFSELALRLIAVGEQTGQLEIMLMRIASIYETTLERDLSRFMSLLTPMLTLAIGAGVGALIMTVMSAIMSVSDLAVP